MKDIMSQIEQFNESLSKMYKVALDNICNKYSEPDEKGKVHCNECPLAVDKESFLCFKNAVYNPYSQEWEPNIGREAGRKIAERVGDIKDISYQKLAESKEGTFEFFYWDGVDDAAQEILKIIAEATRE